MTRSAFAAARSRSAASLFCLAIAAGCTSRHDLLAASDPTGTGGATTASTSTGGSGGAGHGGGAAGQGGAGGGTTTGSGAAGGTGGAGGGAKDAGPPGPTALTVVNGINDYASVRVCFLGSPGGENGGAMPWPAGGLPFGHAQAVDLASVIPAEVDVRPVVLAGDLAQTVGKTCAELLAATPPGVVATALPIVPKSAFVSGKSLIMVPLGCLGGPTHVDAAQALACGSSYSVDTPTASLAVVAASRAVNPGRVSLQVVHANAALPTVDVRVTPGADGAAPWQLASGLSLGSVGPVPPFTELDRIGYGKLDQATLTTLAPGDSTPTSATLIAPLLAQAGIDAADFADGAGFTLVAVGGYPGLAAGPWWHALTYAVIRTVP